MKNFFGNLFGKNPQPRGNGQQQPQLDLFKKGDVIGGKYQVHRLLGKGGFGVVYLVSDLKTRQVRALKTFRDEFLADAGARDGFQKEVLLWVHLGDHPFILPARWVEEFSGRLFVAMDYVAPDAEGRVNLFDHLRTGKAFATELATEWAIQFCLGMEHANAHGVKCHRDIKPANILVSQGVLKISDFGLAAAAETLWKGTGSQGRSTITGDPSDDFAFSVLQTEGGMRCGTPGYMPPEVYRGESADVRSDIYSFGLVLWQMATGSTTPPFVKAYRGNIEAYTREAYEEQMKGRLPQVTGPLRGVIEHCLNPAPSRRFASFGEVRGAIEPILQKLTGHSFVMPEIGEQTAAFWSDKGGSLGALGRHEEALACFDKALAIEPRDALTWSNKGGALVELGRFKDALACFDKALTFDPRHAMAWHNKGGVLSELGRREDAIACYKSAVAVDSRYVSAWNNMGRNLGALGRGEEALTCFKKALEIDSRYRAAWVNMGEYLRALGRHNEALPCFDKAIAIDPRDPMAWNNKGATLAALGRREEAIACYEKTLAVEPQHLMAWYNKAISEDALGKYAMAAKSYRKFVEFAPEQYASHVAYVRQRLRELESAR